MNKNYCIKEYQLGIACIRYIILNDTKKVFMNILPENATDGVIEDYSTYSRDFQFADNYDWYPGALAHIHLSHHSKSPFCESCQFAQSYTDMYFKSQDFCEDDEKSVITTVLTSDEGYDVVHELTHRNGDDGFIVQTSFVNNSDKEFELEAISSSVIDGLSPYSNTEHSEELNIHVFQSGWATEGKHTVYSLSDLNLEKAWGGNFKSHRIGTRGARATADYFPFAAVEDKKAGVMWGMTLYMNSTWQMEFSRYGRDISFSGGLGDNKYSNWSKKIKPGERFCAPVAYIAAVKGDIADLADIMLKMRTPEIESFGEEGMPIIFNEWCTTWGNPTHSGNIEIAKNLQGTGVKYFVTDDGWFKGLVGDWKYDKEKFPYGLKKYTDEIRSMGFIPGVWMEYECTASDSEFFDKKYDDLHLKHDNEVILGQIGFARKESVWDFRKPEAVELVRKNVIDFLKDSGFGYLKIDYNCDIGMVCDGEENEAEEFRKYMNSVSDFVRLIKKEIPDIIIENCSSGGMRLDPITTGITAMSSFSDAHECFEFPVIAANLHYLLPPRQSQIWCVLKPEFDANRYAFTISAGFLGRMCWSGNFAKLSEEQLAQVRAANDFYAEVADIIKLGKSKVYRTFEKINYRFLEGTQAVLRYAEDGQSALLVYHTFEKPEALNIPIDGEWSIEKALYDASVTIDNNIHINETKPIFGNVVLLKKSN